MNQRQKTFALLTLVVLSTAAPGCFETTTYCIRRAALVPLNAPSMRPAALATGPIEAGLGTDAAIWAEPPERRDSRNVGLYVPRAQLSGFLLGSWHRMFSVGLAWEAGLNAGAVGVSPGLVSLGDESVGGIGPHFSAHIPLNDTFILDIGCELKPYRVPSRIAYSDGEGCESATAEQVNSSWSQRDTTSLFIIPRFWLALGADLGWSHVTIAGGVRSHPTNTEVSVEEHTSPSNISPELAYAVYPYIQLAWEFHLQPWLHLAVSIYQPLNFDPIMYAPIVGLSFRMNAVSDSPRFTGQPRI